MRISMLFIVATLAIASAPGISSITGIYYIYSISDSTRVIYEKELPISNSLGELEIAVESEVRDIYSYLSGKQSSWGDFNISVSKFNIAYTNITEKSLTDTELKDFKSLKDQNSQLVTAATVPFTNKAAMDRYTTQYNAALKAVDGPTSSLMDAMAKNNMSQDLFVKVHNETQSVHDYVTSGGDPAYRTAFNTIAQEIASWQNYSSIRTEHEALKTAITTAFQRYDDYISAKSSIDNSMKNVESIIANTYGTLHQLKAEVATNMASSINTANNVKDASLTTFIAFSTAAIIMIIIIPILLTRRISRSFKPLVNSSQTLASGDLTQEITTDSKEDEIRELSNSFKTMQEDLRVLVKEIQQTSQSVSSTSHELASAAEEMNATTQDVSSAIQQISKGAQDQASHVEETAKAMTDLAKGVDDIASRSEATAEVGKQTTTAAEMGRKAVQDTVNKMHEISNVVSETAVNISVLGKQSEEIVQIVDFITNITDQTNLLALNAAIEAARAGEQGRGFAVVAEEVKNLAEDSREAAERIANMIKDVQAETKRAVTAMQKGTKEVEQGLEVATQMDKAFEAINQKARVISEEILSISSAVQQVKTEAERVAKAVDNVASVAEETASASEESASSTEELTASMEEMTAQAQQLSEMAVALQRSATRFTLPEKLRQTIATSGRPSAKKRTRIDEDRVVETTPAGEKREATRRRGSGKKENLKVPQKVLDALKKRRD